MFAHIPSFAGDPIFELGNACRRDPRADKVNLTVGLYYDEDGRIPVLDCVRQAEALLAQQERPRTYLPIEGLESYRLAVQQLVLGADSPALSEQRAATIQSVGGTGALKVGADFLHSAYPDSAVWISDPAWDNHFAIFSGAGIATHRYPYYDPATHAVRFDAMMDVLATLPARSIVLLHPCCHNPSGADLTAEQWGALIALMQRQGLIPFLDLAYQGFGSGLDEDALAVRLLAESGMAYLVANSFSKNFSFYGERCGGLSVVCEQAGQVPAVLGQLIAIVRRIYSNPPVHGAQVIAQVLGDPALNRLWRDEVAAMRARIRSMRGQVVEQLAGKAPDYPARYLLAHQGMFSLTGLRPEQILMLRERHAVYLLDSGRICLPGLNTRNVGRFTDALADVLMRTAPQAQAPAMPAMFDTPAMPDTIEALMRTVSCLRPGADDVARYLQDDSGLKADAPPYCILRPRSTDEVAAIVRACRREGRNLTIQGGRTGLAGGAVPDAGDVVLSLELMDRIERLDAVSGTATVQAGMVLENLCAAVEAQGWYFPMDCGARASCQIGGNVATNVGGNRVLRYGTMRELVLGLEVVRADGTVLTMMNQGLKNNTGLDLKHLFIGTEGTLGVVTRAVLRLFPKPERRHSALVGLAGFDQLAALLKAARGRLATLSSFEVMWREYLQAAATVTQRAEPFDGACPICVLLEVESFAGSDGHAAGADGADAPDSDAAGDRARTDLHRFLEDCLDNGLVLDAILPQSQEQAAQLWRLRDAIGEILHTMAPYVAFDIGIPLALLPDFIARTQQALASRWPAAQRLLFGHLGDGNLHLSTGPYAHDDLEAVESLVYREVERVGGSISAEHGIGRIKKPFLHHSRSAPERELMVEIRRLLDPQARLNPGRIVTL